MGTRSILEKCKQIGATNIVVRFLSVESSTHSKTKYAQINKNMTFEQHSTPSSTPRPLVIIFGWMLAKPTHLRKFSSIYIDEGFDVVTVWCRPEQLLFPKRTKSLVESVMEFCQDGDRKCQPLMSHGFSVGGYMYGEFLLGLLDYPDRYASVRNRMYGQVFDSPVDFDIIPKGLSSAITNNKTGQAVIRKSVQWYLDTFKGAMKNYMRASVAFHSNDLNLPSIYFYSVNDPVVDPELIERLVKAWRERGIETKSVYWNDTPHVCTYKHHPVQYRQHLLEFISKTGIQGNDPAIDRMRKGAVA